MPTSFTPENAAALGGPEWLARRRAESAERFASSPLPAEKEEVWRYSRIDSLDLERFAPAAPLHPLDPVVRAAAGELADRIGSRSALVITCDGVLDGDVEGAGTTGVRIERLAVAPDGAGLLGAVATDPVDLGLLNDAFCPDPLVVAVADGAVVEDPVVVVHVLGTSGGPSAVFPRLVVEAGAGSSARVVELFLRVEPVSGPSGAAPTGVLSVPVTELGVGDDAVLSYLSVHAPGAGDWQVAGQVGSIGARGTLGSFAVALGGGGATYARLRTDAVLAGDKGSSELRAAYLGRGDEMLDFRTLQDHAAPRTRSDLLFKGAVTDRAHSVYSGLVRVRRGAVKADAMQTNHNLVLDEGAHADSVPNLDIEENDVPVQLHASTVGPVDEEQRYYLESRGIPPEDSERLIVAGFFADVADLVPVPGARSEVRRALTERLGDDWTPDGDHTEPASHG